MSQIEQRIYRRWVYHTVGRLGTPRRSRNAARKTAPGVSLPRALNVEKQSSGHLRAIHLKHVYHCTNLPLQVTFPMY